MAILGHLFIIKPAVHFGHPRFGRVPQAGSPQDCPHFRHQLQALRTPGHLYLLPTGYKLGSPHSALRLGPRVPELTELKELPYFPLVLL